jgi:hypothetical protein
MVLIGSLHKNKAEETGLDITMTGSSAHRRAADHLLYRKTLLTIDFNLLCACPSVTGNEEMYVNVSFWQFLNPIQRKQLEGL